MHPDHAPKPTATETRLGRAPHVAGGAVAVGGAVVLIGWILDVSLMRGPIPGLVEMKANTAIAFMLCGVSLILLSGDRKQGPHPSSLGSGHRLAGQAAAGIAFLIGAASLAEYVLGRNLGIDELLFTDKQGAARTVHPGRLAPQTAVNFMLVGCALLMLATSRRRRRAVEPLAVVAWLISLFAVIGYAYGATRLSTVPAVTPIALHTAVAFSILCLGVVWVSPTGVIRSALQGHGAGSILARRLVPVVVVAFPLIGWLRLEGERAALYDSGTGVALYTLVVVLLMGAGIVATAIRLNRAEAARVAAADARRQLAAIVESSGDAILSKDRHGYITSWNEGAADLYGYAKHEAVGRPVSIIVPPRLAGEEEALLRRVLTGERIGHYETERLKKDGSSVEVALTLSPVRDAEDRIVGASSIARDIREQKRAIAERARATAELRRSESFLATILDHLPAMVFVKDAETLRFVRFNKAGETLLGYSKDDLIGKNDHDFFPSEQAEFFAARDRAVLEGRTLVDIPEEPVDTRNQGTRYLHTRKIPILDEEGQPQYLLGISQDVTERKQAADALDAAREEAERANRAKSEFLSRMSHELRTPLNAILGFGQLLEMDGLDESQRDSVDQILRGGRHLLDLINEVLDLSRIEAGTIATSIEPVHLGGVITETLSLIEPLAAERRIRVDPVRADSCDHYASADNQRLKQVLLNLLSNAVKYNREGGAVIVTCTAGEDDRVRVDVTDTGPGIPAEEISKLFVPFERLGAQLGTVEGTGLGLSLSKRLTEAMGGTLRVESEEGVGTTFSLELALSADPAPDAERAEAPLVVSSAPARSQTLLYVEDNPSNLRLVEQILSQRLPVRLLTAMHAGLGLELASNHRPDAILLDLHLPDMSGADVLERLKRDPLTRGIPVVMLSADATDGQVKRLVSAGAHAYLTKPLDVDRFLEVIEEVLVGADGDRERGRAPAAAK